MRTLRQLGFLAFIFLIGICSCGNENRNWETGGLGVQLIFPDMLQDAAIAKKVLFLFTNPPNYVRVKVFTAEGEKLIKTSGIIPIGEREVTLDDIPVGIVTVRAEGLDEPNGVPIYAGEESGVKVKADETTFVTIYLNPISK